ncbi:MAG: Gfo/Idh/MocA family oxidoreductase [Candidatus Hydrogenedentota bacterium]
MNRGAQSRREFLVHSSVLGGTAALHARAGEEKGEAPPETPLRCAVIGVGKRGGALLQTLLELEGVNVVAVADTYDVWRNRALAWCKQKNGDATDYIEYERLLKKENLDAVFIATPPHILASAANEALDEDCAVYIERPMALTWEAAKAIRDKARDKKAVVQVGTQCRSTDLYVRAREILSSGDLGSLGMVQVNHYEAGQPLDRADLPKEATEESVHWPLFLDGTKEYPFDPLRYFHWPHFEEYSGGLNGGTLADYLDACHFLSNAAMPARVMSVGSLTKFRDGRTCPDTVNTIVEYADGLQFTYTATLTNGLFGVEERYICTQGALHIRNMQQMIIYREDIEENLKSQGPNTKAHIDNFLEAVRSNGKPRAPIKEGFHTAVACHMAVLSDTHDKAVTWNVENKHVVV